MLQDPCVQALGRLVQTVRSNSHVSAGPVRQFYTNRATQQTATCLSIASSLPMVAIQQSWTRSYWCTPCFMHRQHGLQLIMQRRLSSPLSQASLLSICGCMDMQYAVHHQPCYDLVPAQASRSVLVQRTYESRGPVLLEHTARILARISTA